MPRSSTALKQTRVTRRTASAANKAQLPAKKLNKTDSNAPKKPKANTTRTKRPQKEEYSATPSSSEEESEGDASDAYEEDEEAVQGVTEDDDDNANSLNSDDLDDDEPVGKKRKRTSTAKKTPTKRKTASASPRKRAKKEQSDEDEEYDDDVDVGSRQQVIGRVVPAPTKGRVPAGRISQNTLDFLKKLKDPEYNDREWFKLNEPVYRLAEKEWVDYVDKLMEKIPELDDEVPSLPAKDAIHRIYRDVRFSNDKTPYKTNMSASFSRSGRKGIFAGYHVSHILRNPSRLKEVIGAKEFVDVFGPAKPHKKGERQNVFGSEDTLKVAPKGVDKSHPCDPSQLCIGEQF
ncbi:hypothetical protein FRB97_002937 [Tulasnella sp. 331]|nr:hypothetical protein FRB97_002937 [Tulasnella sp. 331]